MHRIHIVEDGRVDEVDDGFLVTSAFLYDNVHTKMTAKQYLATKKATPTATCDDVATNSILII